ncbi:hypothetical protein H6P81_018010 [Aristolochia fimbriata]|uniref:Uncharacterized protein n=1 Tax=Aristolochia fimbriata TaxID=158543 RepID=A0AAV7E2Y8_ARIFI|nr:hypothetical protein H6P81_018010 [Aristolochia fimbriata]
MDELVNFSNLEAVIFALMMSHMQGGCPIDYNTITDLFLQLLDDECPVDFIRSLLPVVYLVEQCEKRSRLLLLTQSLEHLENEISQDVLVHIALVKIIYDCNNNPELFLTTNPYYDSRVEDMWCREWIQCCGRKICPDNEFRRQLLDQVVSTAIRESKCPELVSAAVKDFTTADLPHEPLVLLEKIVLQNSAISGNFNPRLNNFGGPAIGDVAVDAAIYEVAFPIFKKFNLNVREVNVLLDNLRSIERAVEFDFRVKEDAVWIHSVKAYLDSNCRKGYIPDYLSLFQTILRTDPQEAVTFALMMSHMQGGCPIDYNTITDLFLQVNPGNAPLERMDPVLWEKDLSPDNEFRRQLLDQVVSTAIPESKCPELVSAAVKDFTTADLPHEPLVLLEKIVLQNSAISGNFNL